MASGPWPWNLNLFPIDLRAKHYEDAIASLRDALGQFESMQRGEAQRGCAVCGDSGHTAESCWFHNVLLLSAMGLHALTAPFWQCFHCGAVFLSERTAEEHFGQTADAVAACIRQAAEVHKFSTSER